MAVETLTKPLDRWDLIAERVYGVPDLAWAIAEANPALAGDLILPAGITLNVPEINTLRRPLTAANPAREDDGDFIALPADDSPAPIPTGGGTASGDYVPLSAVGVTVAPLFNGLVPVSHLPAYPTLASLGAAAIADVNAALALTVPISAIGANSGVAPLDSGGKVPSSFLPSYPTLSSLGGVASSTYTAGLALKADASALTAGLALKLDASAKNAANGVAGLNASSLIDINQLPLGSLFPFTASATFRGGGTPVIGVSLTQAGVDASGQPRYWLVNAAATAGNRLKSLSVLSSGNIVFGHHADDGTLSAEVQLTTSGNLLAPGTIRPGSGASAFSGAQFLPGAIYYRTDIITQHASVAAPNTLVSSTGELSYSDGERWRRIVDGSDLAYARKTIFTGNLPANIPINTYLDYGTLINGGSANIGSVYIISVLLSYTDTNGQQYGHWHSHGCALIGAIQWKAGGTQQPISFRMVDHSTDDFMCNARFNISNINRVIQLSFSKALSYLAGSKYRVTFLRML